MKETGHPPRGCGALVDQSKMPIPVNVGTVVVRYKKNADEDEAHRRTPFAAPIRLGPLTKGAMRSMCTGKRTRRPPSATP